MKTEKETVLEQFQYEEKEGIVSEKTSETMQDAFERVWWKKDPEETERWRDILSEEKLQRPRHFQEVQINIFLPL